MNRVNRSRMYPNKLQVMMDNHWGDYNLNMKTNINRLKDLLLMGNISDELKGRVAKELIDFINSNSNQKITEFIPMDWLERTAEIAPAKKTYSLIFKVDVQLYESDVDRTRLLEEDEDECNPDWFIIEQALNKMYQDQIYDVEVVND